MTNGLFFDLVQKLTRLFNSDAFKVSFWKVKLKMKTCEINVIKYVLFVFNLFFAVSGVAIIVCGAFVLSDVGEFKHFMENRILAPPIVLIVAGCIVFLVASLGCYGAIRESYFLLMGFAVCLLIIFIIELAVGIAAAVYKHEFRTALREVMKDSLDNYEVTKADRIAWDNLHMKLECCGVDGPLDWPKDKRPVSCCHPSREGADPPTAVHCRNATPGVDYMYSYGCFDELQMKAEHASKILIGVGIGIAFVEVIGIILACWLANAVKNKE